MNVTGAIVSIYLESGALRGEQLDPKLNADPGRDEQESGVILTPEQRRQKAYRALFIGGENAPIVQLAGIVHEFNQPHPDFFPALGRWFSGNGAKLSQGLFEYVAGILIRGTIPKIDLEPFLLTEAEKKFGGTTGRVKAEDFATFLQETFHGPIFEAWLEQSIHRANGEVFGVKNAKHLQHSSLKQSVFALYQLDDLLVFSKTLFTGGRPLPLSSAIKRFSNLHRGDKLLVKVGERETSLENHMADFWLSSVRDVVGESIVINYGLKLVQTFFTEFANGFGDKKLTISKWYYQNAYGDPSSTEAMAGYLFKELSLLDLWSKHKEYLKNEFALEVFPDPADQRAFRYLVDQVPNIWLYIRSGMMRSGNDLTRILAERDSGYLIQNYVDLVSVTFAQGLLGRAVPVVESYLSLAADAGLNNDVRDVATSLADRRRIARGTDALRRISAVLFEPEIEGNYHTTIGYKLMLPFIAMVRNDRRHDTERFIMKISEELSNTPDDVLNRFYREMNSNTTKGKRGADKEALKTTADLLRHQKLPEVVGHLRRFFDDQAVRPALNFLAEKIDDGTLERVLLFVRRVLGLRGSV